MKSIGWRSRQMIRSHRRHPIFKGLASVAQKYLRAWHNDNFWDFEANGEQRVLRAFARWAGDRPLTVWDAGAHEGEWAREAHGELKHAVVHSFEILGPTAEKLSRRLASEPWSVVRNLGLSDRTDTIPVTLNLSSSTTSAITPRLEDRHYAGAKLATLQCSVTTVDALVADGVPPPDLLKIDVEGHELAVMRGARALLASGAAPALIQFEYGDTWLPESATLRTMHATLTAAGYQVGRIYPDHVDFSPYTSADDNFRMGNFVAVKDRALAKALGG